MISNPRGKERLNTRANSTSVGFLRGQMANAFPPEVGLRMVQLYDAIRASAAQNGVPLQAPGSYELLRSRAHT